MNSKYGLSCNSGEYCMEMNNSNGRWVGISQAIIDTTSAIGDSWSDLNITKGTELTLSWYQMVNDISRKGRVGLHHRINDLSCTKTFEDSGDTTNLFIQEFVNDVIYVWERKSFTFTVGDN